MHRGDGMIGAKWWWDGWGPGVVVICEVVRTLKPLQKFDFVH